MLKAIGKIRFDSAGYYYVLTYDERTLVNRFETLSDALKHRQQFMKSLMERDNESRL